MIRHFFLLFCVLATLNSCTKTKQTGKYSEGKLEYRISYLNAKEDNYDPSFLPKKMVLEFNQEYSINRIDGFMGFFKLGNITYFKSRKVKTHLKVLDKNYSYLGGRHEMMCCFDCMEGMSFEEDTATTMIAGLASKKVEVTLPGDQDSFTLYYTNDIKLSHPNSTNPYKKIDGVLTSFRLIMGPYHMQFDAIKFDPNGAPTEEMKIPDGTVNVKRIEMVTILNRLMEQNM